MTLKARSTRMSASVLDNILDQRLSPESDAIGGINLCTQFISYWDDDLRLAELNDSLFFDGMVDHEGGKGNATNRFILDYMPDLVDLGVWDDIREVRAGGGRLSIPNYHFNGYNLNDDVRCTVHVAKLDNYTVITGEHVVYSDELFDCPRVCDFQTEQDRLNRTIDVLLQKFSNAGKVKDNAVRANLESEVIPLISQLEATHLDDFQTLAVSTIRQCLESIVDDYNAKLNDANLGLSFREREIAALVHRGKTAREIACLLGISKRTVEAHKANIQRKLREMR